MPTISHVSGPSVATLPPQRQATLSTERLDTQVSSGSPQSARVPSSSLEHVDPKNSLLIGPMPCEEQCAYIRNSTVDAIQVEDVSMTAYRYLQSRKGRDFTKSEAIRQGKKAAILLPLGVIPGIPSALYTLPLAGNATRYLKTKKMAEEYLNQISPEMLSEIKSIEYTDENVEQNLYEVLQKYGIPISKEFQEHMRPVNSSEIELP
ncbi:hypothetical protein [Noviherbaspirillum saxi]|nr:hypothetical protein [Noviherbaspirillum saxi]